MFKNNKTAFFARKQGTGRTKHHGEICHAHPNDGSMHLDMHPADVKVVIESGWEKAILLSRTTTRGTRFVGSLPDSS
jgi:hypothetical protein